MKPFRDAQQAIVWLDTNGSGYPTTVGCVYRGAVTHYEAHWSDKIGWVLYMWGCKSYACA